MPFCMFLFLSFIAFPERKDAIFSNLRHDESVLVRASGSIGVYVEKKCVLTSPNASLSSISKNDWCSNIAKNNNDKPWISFSLPNKAFQLTGYSVRNGCCYYTCCCLDDSTILKNSGCCCRLYSFSLQGSNDNKTWTILHNVEKAEKFYFCTFRTYEIESLQTYKYIRFVQEAEYPNCPFCMQINQIELYGTTVTSFDSFLNDENDEESVSIIGKINHKVQE